jgi:UTP--glucose-1-phosphate uridylyltransferase
MNDIYSIIPAAGLGTRLLPFTKAVPKELIPVVSTPVIHYIITESIQAGIADICIVINREKQAIKNYVTHNEALSAALAKKNLLGRLEGVQELINNGRYLFCYQQSPRGLGHAIAVGAQKISAVHKPHETMWYAVLLPDDLIDSDRPTIGTLYAIAREYCATVIAVRRVERHQLSSYGVIAPHEEIQPGIFSVASLVEKPKPHDAPSSYAVVGRYVLATHVIEALQHLKGGVGREIQLTDAINDVITRNHRVLAYLVTDRCFDLGNPQGFLEANMHYAAKTSHRPS